MNNNNNKPKAGTIEYDKYLFDKNINNNKLILLQQQQRLKQLQPKEEQSLYRVAMAHNSSYRPSNTSNDNQFIGFKASDDSQFKGFKGFGSYDRPDDNNDSRLCSFMRNESSYRPDINNDSRLFSFMRNESSYRPSLIGDRPISVFPNSTTMTPFPTPTPIPIPFSTPTPLTLTGQPIVYSNRQEDIDLCYSCYTKTSINLKNKLNLTPVYKGPITNTPLYVWCDVCTANIYLGDGPETKLQVLLKLKDLELDIDTFVSSCVGNQWNQSIDVLFTELSRGGMKPPLARGICDKLSTTIQVPSNVFLNPRELLLIDTTSLPRDCDSFTSILNCVGDQIFNLIPREKTTFISPYSIGVALMMLYQGTTREVKQELTDLFRLRNGQYIRDDVMKEKFKLIMSTGQLEVANALVTKRGFNFTNEYIAKMEDIFAAQVGHANAQDVNRWVSEKTHGKIKEVLKQDPDFALINVIYFKAKWQYPFDKARTYDGIFTNLNGNVNVKYMTQQRTFHYFENESYQAVSMPFIHGLFSAIIVLPRSSEKLIPSSQVIWNQLRNCTPSEVKIILPRFTATSEFVLNSIIQRLGVEKAFRLSSDYSFTAQLPIQIDQIIHKVCIEVDEDGAEAAAVTAITALFGCAAPVRQIPIIDCCRPFQYAIVDNDMGKYLFKGIVTMNT